MIPSSTKWGTSPRYFASAQKKCNPSVSARLSAWRNRAHNILAGCEDTPGDKGDIARTAKGMTVHEGRLVRVRSCPSWLKPEVGLSLFLSFGLCSLFCAQGRTEQCPAFAAVGSRWL